MTQTNLRNPNIIEAFLNHQKAEINNLTSTGDKLFSYKNVIAQWVEGKLIVNDTKYSPTSTKHRDILRRVHQEKEVRVVLDIPKDTQNLEGFLL